MTIADRGRWDVRHAASSDDDPRPPVAVEFREELVPTAGRALDIACGRGSIAVWLALRGLTVDAVDVSSVGVGAGQALAERHGVVDRVRFTEWDLDAGLPDADPFDVVVCQRFRMPDLYPSLASAVAAGGLLAVTVLSEVGAGPGPFAAPAGELLAAFTGLGLEVLLDSEQNGKAHLVARRPG
ncbi:SAM-dependent methyltransferase [Rhodococcus opacus]|nr:class I SAM-dependent methyltransferase [Rhodococcus opacus]QZS52592.1 methyltransferase domain-containing protein [Rhodococcus opacus]RKM64865.1 SAM-dependent methyltransferase [Rhodococcus opacus]